MGLSFSCTEEGVALIRAAVPGRAAVDLRFRWIDLNVLEPRDPWPSLYVGWRHGDADDHFTFHPERRIGPFPFSASETASAVLATAVEALIRSVEANAPRAHVARILRRGWLEHPMVAWEDAEWPTEVSAGEGAFRTALTGPRVLARRERPSAFESMLVWLASSPHKKWRDTPRELALTEEHLFARFRDGKARAVPRSALRRRLSAGADAVYVFGRGTMLVVPEREGCELAAALDGQLGEPPLARGRDSL